jgi:hypothetical protein
MPLRACSTAKQTEDKMKLTYFDWMAKRLNVALEEMLSAVRTIVFRIGAA